MQRALPKATLPILRVEQTALPQTALPSEAGSATPGAVPQAALPQDVAAALPQTVALPCHRGFSPASVHVNVWAAAASAASALRSSEHVLQQHHGPQGWLSSCFPRWRTFCTKRSRCQEDSARNTAKAEAWPTPATPCSAARLAALTLIRGEAGSVAPQINSKGFSERCSKTRWAAAASRASFASTLVYCCIGSAGCTGRVDLGVSGRSTSGGRNTPDGGGTGCATPTDPVSNMGARLLPPPPPGTTSRKTGEATAVDGQLRDDA